MMTSHSGSYFGVAVGVFRSVFGRGNVIKFASGDVSSSTGVGDSVVGSHKASSENRTTAGLFDRIEIAGFVEVQFRRADAPSIEVHGEDNLLEFLETHVVGSTLHVSSKPGANLVAHLPLMVVATAPTIHQAILTGSGGLRMSGLEQDSLSVDLRGSGDVRVEGGADTLTLKLQGSGDIDAAQLEARKVVIKLDGSGDIRAYAAEEADVSVRGSGDVNIAGNPGRRSESVLGSGGVIFTGKIDLQQHR